jgi:hypothetical protein
MDGGNADNAGAFICPWKLSSMQKKSPHSNEYGDFLILMPESCDSSVDVAKQRPKGKVISLANNRVTMTGHWKLSSMQKKIPALKRVRGLPYFNA